jgi:tetratricopeptide (TPR) repeat protein
MNLKIRLIPFFFTVLYISVSLATFCWSDAKKIDGEIILKLLDSKEYDKATVEIEKAFKIEPECAVCYFAQGWISEQRDRRSQAMQNYHKAIELAPDYPPYYYFRGRLKMNMAMFQGSGFSKENYNRGIRRAIEDFTKGILLKPGNIDLYYRERASAYIYISEYRKALFDLQKLLPMDKKDSHLLCNIGKCYLELGDTDQALSYLLKADACEMISDPCIVDIALAYSMKNEKDKALKYLETAVDRDELTAEFGINESDPRWDNIRETDLFQKVKNGRRGK